MLHCTCSSAGARRQQVVLQDQASQMLCDQAPGQGACRDACGEAADQPGQLLSASRCAQTEMCAAWHNALQQAPRAQLSCLKTGSRAPGLPVSQLSDMLSLASSGICMPQSAGMEPLRLLL